MMPPAPGDVNLFMRIEGYFLSHSTSASDWPLPYASLTGVDGMPYPMSRTAPVRPGHGALLQLDLHTCGQRAV